MGTCTREGYAVGMTVQEAKRNWLNELDEMYGTGGYQGAGRDLREVTKVKQIKAPVPMKKPTGAKIQTTKANVQEGKWVNGYIVTDDISGVYSFSPYERSTYKLVEKLTDAKTAAQKMASSLNKSIGLFPTRLIKDRRGNLHMGISQFEAVPKGGKDAVPGQWYFEGEFRT